jgi:hypothetical protein
LYAKANSLEKQPYRAGVEKRNMVRNSEIKVVVRNSKAKKGLVKSDSMPWVYRKPKMQTSAGNEAIINSRQVCVWICQMFDHMKRIHSIEFAIFAK